MSLDLEAMRMASQQAIGGMDFYLTLKHEFAKLLAHQNDVASGRGHEGLFYVSPRTFVFPEDFEKWRATAADEPDTIWISKPGGGACGEGIYLVTDPSTIKPERDRVMQEYIVNPHLLDSYKYTLRVFVAVTSLDPLRAWVFPDGLTKSATQTFSADRASLDNLFMHLTNPAVLRSDISGDFTKQRTTHTEYRKRLRADGIDDDRLFRSIRTLIAKSLLAVREAVLHFQRHNAKRGISFDGQYMLLGYDILVDADMRPWVLEANAGPSLETEAGHTTSGRQEQQLKERVAADMLRLAGRLPRGEVEFEPLFPSAAMIDWVSCYEVMHEHDWADLYPFARKASKQKPNDWRTLDQYAIAAYYAGKHAEGASANEQLLANEFLPTAERERVTRNLAFCRTKVVDGSAQYGKLSHN